MGRKLDSLTCLLPEDRQARKATLRQADALLEDLDAIKTDIAALLQRLAADTKPSADHAGLGVVNLPPASMWAQERLDLPFQQQESSTGYVLVAKAPALDTKTLRLRVKGSLLTISGVCMPKAQAAEQMQQAVSEQLLRRYTLQRLLARGGVAAVTHSLYAQL